METVQNESLHLIIKKMNEENQRILAAERIHIVDQVIESLQQSGLIPKNTRLGTSTSNKLDAGVNRLLNHSISKNGLTLPNIVSPSKQSIVNKGKKLLIHTNSGQVDAVQDEEERHTIKRSKKAKKKKSAAIKASPLQKAKHVERKLAALDLSTRKNNISFVPTSSMDCHIPFKVDSRTAIILAKSRKMVAETNAGLKKSKWKQKENKGSMVDDDAVVEDDVDGQEYENDMMDDNKEHESKVEIHVDTAEEVRPNSSASNSKPSSSQSQRIQSAEERISESRESTRSSLMNEENILQQGNSTNLRMMNNDDWENELARQIIFIYTQSEAVKKREMSTNPTTTPLPKVKSNRSVQSGWEPSHEHNGKIIINVPRIPPSIWFSGSGAIKSIWCGLVSQWSDEMTLENAAHSVICKHPLCEKLRKLEMNKKYSSYTSLVEQVIHTTVRQHGMQPMYHQLWKQLIITTNAFANRCTELKVYSQALELLKQAENYIQQDDYIAPSDKLQVTGFIKDSLAHYYYSRNKCHAASAYIQSATNIHLKLQSYSHYAKCLLHFACIQSKQKQHLPALHSLTKVLSLVEDQKLEQGGSSAQKLCMISICYHNLAITQLHLRNITQASISSQNSRRLARLSLSYSNRWFHQFHETHKTVVAAILALHALESSPKPN